MSGKGNLLDTESVPLMAEVGERMRRLAGDPSMKSIDDLRQALFDREGD